MIRLPHASSKVGVVAIEHVECLCATGSLDLDQGSANFAA
jgi:hypothetical protein